MRSYREAFAAASSFSPNPDEPIGIYKFDLAIREHVDSHLANGEINYYVNTADGSIGLFDLESIRQAMGGQAIPGVTYEFAVLRGAGNALMCGQSVEYGKACIQAGGDATPGATNWSLDYGNMNEFLRSVANTPPTAMATPVPNTSDMRGTAYEGSTMTLWYDNVPSTVPTEQPWLGFCSGLFKDYLAQVNRVARYVVHEGADTDGGDITCQLLDFRMQQRSFDTGSYPLVTAFTTQGIEESTDIGRRAMRGEMSCEQLAEEMREFARKRGLPVPDDTPCK
ncbi:hypothetical protein CSC70_04840 [Pseudoxanthomonas kalamensis DSM 18571]|uniref:hypothetical protein n=1 Tax=Pseudoxanthomonas kalamensis TaxID=289483 RepID=UPI001391BFB6|nr:hypothetical protein [Pseudoxanthomonas kalamensis]KAF1711245.1 hypothetical protein CSC70_04840 [Pseudoxanthomonas kalamensis DSM 18571]